MFCFEISHRKPSPKVVLLKPDKKQVISVSNFRNMISMVCYFQIEFLFSKDLKSRNNPDRLGLIDCDIIFHNQL